MIRQLKLNSGEEILCDVIQEDDEFPEIAVKHALKIVSKIQDGYKYYTFKNFMVFADDPEVIVVIRDDAVIAYTAPAEELVVEYKKALAEMYKQKEVDMFDETQHSFYGDSDASNVVPFKPTRH